MRFKAARSNSSYAQHFWEPLLAFDSLPFQKTDLLYSDLAFAISTDERPGRRSFSYREMNQNFIRSRA
jgi:hypothetical protein